MTRKNSQAESVMSKKYFPYATIILVVVNFLIYNYINKNNMDNIVYIYGMYPGAINNVEIVRVFANAFLHIESQHLIGNMTYLLISGILLEKYIGTKKFISIYFFSIIGSSLFIDLMGRVDSVHYGASGAIEGVMASLSVYFFMHPKAEVNINRLDCIYILLFMAIKIIYDRSYSNEVSWQGHAGGAIMGICISIPLLKYNIPINKKIAKEIIRKYKKISHSQEFLSLMVRGELEIYNLFNVIEDIIWKASTNNYLIDLDEHRNLFKQPTATNVLTIMYKLGIVSYQENKGIICTMTIYDMQYLQIKLKENMLKANTRM